MLQRIWITSFLLIDHLDIHFEPGLHVITGETGAGKSMLLEAIGCLMGQRAEAKWVRTGAQCAEIGAVLAPPYPTDTKAWLMAQSFDPEEELWVRRTIDNQGKSKIWINQKPMPLSSLKQCMSELIELGHQHMHLQWLKPDTQRQWLDVLGGLDTECKEVQRAWDNWQQAKKHLEEARSGEQQRHYEREVLNQRKQDLEGLRPTEHAWEEMNRLHTRIAGSADRRERIAQVRRALYDEKESLIDQLHTLKQHLLPIIDQSDSAKSAWELLEQAYIHLQEAVHSLKEEDEEDAEADFATLDARIAKWHRIARRYQISPADLYAFWQATLLRLKELEALSSTELFEKKVEEAYAVYQEKAQLLTHAREQAALKAENEISFWLPRLNLPEAQLTIELKTLDEPKQYGTEQVIMMFQSHPGLPRVPLAEGASGGELARIALILALIQHDEACLPVRFFDEVDTGISGATVAEVGRLLQHQVKQGQIVCISHQPQMAACADIHWKIEKTSDYLPVTHMKQLDAQDRCIEIARLMAGGSGGSQSALQHAQQLRQELARSSVQQSLYLES